MRLDHLDKAKRDDVQRRLLRGYGELVEVPYTDLVERIVATEDGGKKGAKREWAPEPAVATYYIGRMSPGQTSTVVTILARVFGEVMNEQGFNIAKLPSLLDGPTMTTLVATVLQEDEAFVESEWDLAWVVKALAVFLRYNDFFAVMESVNSLVSSFTKTIQAQTAE